MRIVQRLAATEVLMYHEVCTKEECFSIIQEKGGGSGQKAFPEKVL